MKRPRPKWNKEGWIAEATAEPPDADRYVPDGMIRLAVRPWFNGDSSGTELIAPAGHPVYRTLIGVDEHTVWGDGKRKIVGTVAWATPEAVAESAEIYAGKVAQGEVPDRDIPSNGTRHH